MGDDGNGNKRFKLSDCVLAVICVVLTVEAAAPAATIGNSQFFWWIFLLLFFCLPYSLISAELGTTYKGNGGLSDWISRAYGDKVGSRVALYYWINFPIWTASVAVLVTDYIPFIFGFELDIFTITLIRLMFIWSLVFLSLNSLAENKWMFNISSLLKTFIFLLLGIGGIYVALTAGAANPMTLESLKPKFDSQSLSYISVIIFNFMGFEVITTYVNDMKNPKSEIPKAVIIGGICVTFLYLIASFGIGVSIPISKISPSMGILDSITLLFPTTGRLFIVIIGCMLIFSMFANQLSWAFGINYVAKHSADTNSGLPEFFKITSKNGQPLGIALTNGVIATILVLVAPLIPSEELFWNFFALNLVMLLFSYVLLFPAFLRLRVIDKDLNRPYKAFGDSSIAKFFALTSMALLIISIFFTIVPLSKSEVHEKLPLLLGTIIVLLIIEIVVYYNTHKKIKRSSGI